MHVIRRLSPCRNTSKAIYVSTLSRQTVFVRAIWAFVLRDHPPCQQCHFRRSSPTNSSHNLACAALQDYVL